MDYEALMRAAITEAAKAEQAGDIPVGAVLADANGRIVSLGHNTREQNQDPLGHAEIQAISNLEKSDWRLDQMTMVVTLEPCAMCAGAIQQARIQTLVFGAFDDKAGAVGSVYDIPRDRRLGKPIEVVAGVLQSECEAQLDAFFSLRRTSGSR